MDNATLLFIIFTILNTALSTVNCIFTIKATPIIAGIMNAIYGVGNILYLIYAVGEVPLIVKIIIVAIADLFTVFIIKYVENKIKKDREWRIELKIDAEVLENVKQELNKDNIGFHYLSLSPSRTIVTCYARTKHETNLVKAIGEKYGAKFFVSESEDLWKK